MAIIQIIKTMKNPIMKKKIIQPKKLAIFNKNPLFPLPLAKNIELVEMLYNLDTCSTDPLAVFLLILTVCPSEIKPLNLKPLTSMGIGWRRFPCLS